LAFRCEDESCIAFRKGDLGLMKGGFVRVVVHQGFVRVGKEVMLRFHFSAASEDERFLLDTNPGGMVSVIC
jgi:hypothetical protein